MRRLLLTLPLVLLLLVAGTYWLAGREATLRWALDKVTTATQGALQFEGISGNLLGDVRVDQARFSSPDAAVTADRVALDFSLAALLQRRLEIDRLQADSVFVKLTPSDEPLQPPTTLALPFGFEVTRLQIGMIDIRRGDFSVMLRNVQARLASSGSDHTLELQRIDSPWGRVSGTLNLNGHAPFDLKSTAELIPLDGDRFQPRMHLDLQGPLAEIRTRLKAQSSWLQAGATALIQPFQPVQVTGLKADLNRLDLRAMDPSLPKASLSGRLTATQSQQTQLTGEVELINRTPGPLTGDGLPLKRLAAHFMLDPDQLELDNLQLGMHLGATLTGKPVWMRMGSMRNWPVRRSTCRPSTHGWRRPGLPASWTSRPTPADSNWWPRWPMPASATKSMPCAKATRSASAMPASATRKARSTCRVH